ncbi:PAP/25A-associated [Penicillium griseofulvum]|uniref:polynucleotide adenylyltransferase n=1 Tax=Penicillium patulum TaxID=5078 RepID=A0A135LFB3_PENPA|nr:PAP/25A-associated [Penicillium griseofulvum]KXG47628.1 PAP/25A-associated [Penicillium griseofulvum]
MPPSAPFQFRGSSNYRGSRPNPRHEFTFRYQKPATSDRPLLSSKRESTPERLQGDTETKSELKFAALSTLSDSEEAEMEMSDDSNTERPRKKRALGLDGPQDVVPASVPKWSNPDPYTALPPPAETTNKRVDVVKLIRKARLETAPKTDEMDAVKQNSDFISLGMDLEPEIPQSNAPDNAPKGPKAQEVLDPAIKSRKRTRDDEIKGYSRKTGKPASRFNQDGSVIDQWEPLSPETGTPWFEGTPTALHIGTQLHNEILSFYHWAKPQEFEHIVRADLVNRLETAFQQRYRNVSIRAFGSFASGLYLPTADIDLVLLSNTFVRTGVRTFGERKGQIYSFSAFLKSTNLAVPNSIECIAGARVPILKYVDKLTGLRVDLSFDNDSGLIANDTFQKWKTQYPMMPVILAVIKQFLLIRGLNEVPTGGLGGFSITCLVTSILQHMPQGHLQPNLATVLLDFLNFYGKQFCYDRLAIRMDPPGYFNKGYHFGNPDRLTIEDPNNRDNDISGGTKEIGLIFRAFSNAHTALRNRMEYLTLIQGSNKSILETIIAANFDEYIEQRFQLRRVFMTEERFARYREAPPPPPPLESLPVNEAPSPPRSDGPGSPMPEAPSHKRVKKAIGKSKGTKSEPEDVSSDEAPGSEAKSAKTRKGETRRQICQERAARLKRLRPDLTNLPNTLSLRQARRHAGYETDEQMNADLDRREQKILASA